MRPSEVRLPMVTPAQSAATFSTCAPKSAQMKLMNTTSYPSTEKDIFSRAGKCPFFFTFTKAGIYVVY